MNNINSKVREIIKYVELEGMEKSRINELSGGQVQRVAIARAIVKEPKVVLADEPTGNLDYKTSLKIMEILKNISKKCLVVVVTHDESLAGMYGDKIINIFEGKIVGKTDNISDKVNYKISIRDNVSGENFTKIFDNKKNAVLYIEQNVFREKQNNMNIICEEMEKGEQDNEITFESAEKRDTKLSRRRLLRFAYLNYKAYKGKIIVNTIVMGIVFGIVCFLGELIISDKINSEAKYISQNNRTGMVLCQKKNMKMILET